MRVRLLGTGAADGWPNPWCRCPSCQSERNAGRFRSRTAIIVDDVLLCDLGPDVLATADRSGVDVAAIRHVLITHDHADHLWPHSLLIRQWTRPANTIEASTIEANTIDVVGPPTVLDALRQWLPDETPGLRLLPVHPGDTVLLGESDQRFAVTALAAAHPATHPGATAVGALLYDITSPDGRRLLYATDTGPLTQANVDQLADAAFDVVLLEETFGNRCDLAHPTGHHCLRDFQATLLRLREVGAVVGTTLIAPIHLGHHNPPAPELRRVMRGLGARLLADGDVLDTNDLPETPKTGLPATVSSRHARTTLVLGGARSGKSSYAESLLADHMDVEYVATGYDPGLDEEWRRRVDAHKARRPPSWLTTETRDLEPILLADGGPVIVDCLTLWLSGVLDELRTWSAARWEDVDAPLTRRVESLVSACSRSTRDLVVVSNEVGSGIVPATASGRFFQDELGRLNAAVAAAADDVVLMVAGVPLPLTPFGAADTGGSHDHRIRIAPQVTSARHLPMPESTIEPGSATEGDNL